MSFILIVKAFFLGVINAAPIGPVGLLCLRKNAGADRLSGLFTALGMAVAYGIISFCVLFGMKWIKGMLEAWRCPFEMIAGAALIYMGYRGLKAHEAVEKQTKNKSRLIGDFFSSFAMTLFNPVPFATFAVILTTLKVLKGELDLIADIEFSVCVFLGTISFWLVVNQLLHMVKKRSTSDWCRWISHGAAVVLIGLGAIIFLAGIRQGLLLLFT